MDLPQGFIAKYQKLLGAESADFFAALKKDYQKGFRLNPRKTTAEKLAKQLDLSQPAPYSPVGYYGTVAGKTPEHQAGLIYSQEISAMAVAEVLAIEPDERVLDLCAAPGGKTTRLADFLGPEGLLVANEIFPKRAKVLSENLERWGVGNSLVTNHAPQELVPHFPQFFQKILVDAPCSGEGMFQKEPAALTQWSQDYVEECAARQKEILQSALAMLAPGGTLVYSTCTFAPEEDEEIVDYCLANFDLELVEISASLFKGRVDHGRPSFSTHSEITKTIRLWPHLNAGAGHFIAKFRKKNVEEGVTQPTVAKSKRKKTSEKNKLFTKEEETAFKAFTTAFPIPFETQRLVKFGDSLWQLPPQVNPDVLKGLRLLRNGLHVGDFLKKRFVPSYSLALTLHEYQALPHVTITRAEWQRYVQGETLTISGNLGLVLVVCDEMVISFGKLTQGTLKNYFPKGLRFH